MFFAVALGVLLYVLIDAALRVLEPQYSLIHNPESDYGNGRLAWLMDLNFVLRGALSLAAAAVLWRAVERSLSGRIGVALVAVWAIASALLAFFPDDLAGSSLTFHGRVHLVAAGVAFVSQAVGAVMVSQALRSGSDGRRVARLLLGLAVTGMIALALSLTLRSYFGVLERLFIALELLWLLLAAWSVITGHETSEIIP